MTIKRILVKEIAATVYVDVEIEAEDNHEHSLTLKFRPVNITVKIPELGTIQLPTSASHSPATPSTPSRPATPDRSQPSCR